MSVFLRADWRDLAVLTYSIDPAVLRPLLPPGLRLDAWQDEALVSLVGFRFLHTRVLGCPMPFWGSFPEVNLRFYVCRDTPQGLRRGVVFVKEFVPYFVVAAIARGLYNENYHSVPMTCPERGEYRWTVEGRENRLRVRAGALAKLPEDDSLDTFILDHHWGYCVSRAGARVEYEVERLPWRVFPVEGFDLDIDCERVYGAEFAEALSKPPISVVLAEGSAVSGQLRKERYGLKPVLYRRATEKQATAGYRAIAGWTDDKKRSSILRELASFSLALVGHGAHACVPDNGQLMTVDV